MTEVRAATREDAASIAHIYNQGIEDRVATFETEPRSASDVEGWFESDLPKVVVVVDGEMVAYAAAFPYSDRCCYAGVAEFSVYVDRDRRGKGFGAIAMSMLIKETERKGLHKLLSRVFVENDASRALLRRLGFTEVGVHRKHGRLDGRWRDVVAVEILLEANL